MTVTFREYRTLDEQLKQLGLNSPDRTQSVVLKRGETLTGVSSRHYGRPQEWRLIADCNGIEDPRRLGAGTFVALPPVDQAAGAGIDDRGCRQP